LMIKSLDKHLMSWEAAAANAATTAAQ
jgi:hypothetical protein